MGYIDHPSPLEQIRAQMRLSGWVLSTQGVPEVEVCLESPAGAFRQLILLGHPRPDVLPHLPPEFPQEANCGFDTTVPVSELEGGVYSLCLMVRTPSAPGTMVLSRRQVLIQDDRSFHMYCTQPWSTLYVTWEGKVRPCCFTEHVVGDVSCTSAEGVWEGEAMRRFRSCVIQGKVVRECADCLAGKSNPDFIRPLRDWLPFSKSSR
jgi:hypothetical protein